MQPLAKSTCHISDRSDGVLDDAVGAFFTIPSCSAQCKSLHWELRCSIQHAVAHQWSAVLIAYFSGVLHGRD